MKSFYDFIYPIQEEEKKTRIIMLGGPGSGKSTYTAYLVSHFNIPHVYPGGMLRKEVEKNSEIGQQVKNIISKGEFVPNSIVLDLIKDRLAQPDAQRGYVLDGWPRYMEQVRDMEQSGIGYDHAVFLDVSKEEIMRRLLARGRADDTVDIINNRIALYKKETGPVIEYLKSKPGFFSVKGEGKEPEDIAKEIIFEIENVPRK